MNKTHTMTLCCLKNKMLNCRNNFGSKTKKQTHFLCCDSEKNCKYSVREND